MNPPFSIGFMVLSAAFVMTGADPRNVILSGRNLMCVVNTSANERHGSALPIRGRPATGLDLQGALVVDEPLEGTSRHRDSVDDVEVQERHLLSDGRSDAADEFLPHLGV